MKQAFLKRYYAPNGYQHVLRIGLPLSASMASATVTQFTDRMFLGNYSLEALAASLSASVTNYMIMSFFIGLVSYVNVFIAQYTGSEQHEKLGSALWQGMWVALGSSVIIALAAIPAEFIFSLAGHAPEVQALECSYYRILCLGSVSNMMAVCLSTFYSGRGMTRPIMIVNGIGALVNIPLDYAMINGVWGFPEMGIEGAGYATVISWTVTATLFALLVFGRNNEEKFSVLSSMGYSAKLMRRLLKYGLPNAMQMFIDLFGFTFFILLVGRLGNNELAATNMVFSLNHFTFLPMLGLHIAAETMVGQAIGAGKPEDGEKSATNCVHLCMVWAALVGAVFIFLPGPLLDVFKPSEFTPEQYAPIREAGRILLIYVACYSFIDGIGIVYMGALKGAGDTMFAMKTAGFVALFALILPSYLIIEVLHWNIYLAWACVILFVVLYASIAYWRFKAGGWKKLSVIEH